MTVTCHMMYYLDGALMCTASSSKITMTKHKGCKWPWQNARSVCIDYVNARASQIKYPSLGKLIAMVLNAKSGLAVRHDSPLCLLSETCLFEDAQMFCLQQNGGKTSLNAFYLVLTRMGSFLLCLCLLRCAARWQRLLLLDQMITPKHSVTSLAVYRLELQELSTGP